MMVKINQKDINISKPDKVLFPDDGLTKKDIIDYYRDIADFMLPHIRGRLVMMQRFPDGISEGGFYQKDVPDYFPDWIHRKEVKKKEGGKITQVICDQEAALVYLANQACITWHTWLSRADQPDHPDKVILDLDPPGSGFEKIRESLSSVKDYLEDKDLTAFLMTTGSSGLHLVLPIQPEQNFKEMKEKVDRLTAHMADQLDDYFTTQQSRNKREGRIYLDGQRNNYAQTGVAPYSLRPLEKAPVATPVSWHEAMKKDFHSRTYHIKNIFRRLGQVDDPWTSFNHTGIRKKNLRSMRDL